MPGWLRSASFGLVIWTLLNAILNGWIDYRQGKTKNERARQRPLTEECEGRDENQTDHRVC